MFRQDLERLWADCVCVCVCVFLPRCDGDLVSRASEGPEVTSAALPRPFEGSSRRADPCPQMSREALQVESCCLDSWGFRGSPNLRADRALRESALWHYVPAQCKVHARRRTPLKGKRAVPGTTTQAAKYNRTLPATTSTQIQSTWAPRCCRTS